MSYDFANYYGVDPWGDITLNEREWYDPVLRDWYYRASVYSQHVTMKVDMAGPGSPKARTIHFNDIIPASPNIAPIDNRAMEATRLYTDSYQRSVTTERYGNGMSLHRESSMFSYWQKAGGGTTGLQPLIDLQLGQIVTDHVDLLARNAFFQHPMAFMGLNSASGFGTITDSDKLTTEMIDQVDLSVRSTRRLFTPLPIVQHNSLLCITTPGTIYDLKREVGTDGAAGGLNFVEVSKYQGGTNLMTGEIGMWRGVRFIESPLAVLYNVGTIEHQTTIKAAVVPGDGAADPETTLVEGSFKVGQPGATHYILVNDASGFSIGDTVTIHKLRHDSTTLSAMNNQGVLNGVIYTDPMRQDREVVDIDTSGGGGAHKLVLSEPYTMTQQNGKGLETDLGGTVFGYVTLGKTIHTALFLRGGMESGLVAGVAQAPVFRTPLPIDDFESIYRVTYDMWLKYQMWNARNYRVAFLTGQNATNNKFWR